MWSPESCFEGRDFSGNLFEKTVIRSGWMNYKVLRLRWRAFFYAKTGPMLAPRNLANLTPPVLERRPAGRLLFLLPSGKNHTPLCLERRAEMVKPESALAAMVSNCCYPSSSVWTNRGADPMVNRR